MQLSSLKAQLTEHLVMLEARTVICKPEGRCELLGTRQKQAGEYAARYLKRVVLGNGSQIAWISLFFHKAWEISQPVDRVR